MIRTRRRISIQKETLTIEYKTLEVLFLMRLDKAAIVLGIGTTALKNVCRKLGIRVWPYRLHRKPNDSLYWK
jgi:hypothetical protein